MLYFVDTYANYHDPQLAEALVAVLEHNAIAVYVHPDQQSSGMPMISLGASTRPGKSPNATWRCWPKRCARLSHRGHRALGGPGLTHEYPALFDDDDARLVAANTSEACTYLWKLHQAGKLQLDLRPVNAALGYHMPCHLRALQVGSPGENLLRLIPGLVVNRTENGCSGMAGTFGLKRENYRASLRAGWRLINSLRSPRLQAGTTECSACKMQMEQGRQQTHDPPDEAAGAGLRSDARSGRTAVGPGRGAGRHMKVRVRLFAVAKQLAGRDSLSLELPDGARPWHNYASDWPRKCRRWRPCCRTCCSPSDRNMSTTIP